MQRSKTSIILQSSRGLVHKHLFLKEGSNVKPVGIYRTFLVNRPTSLYKTQRIPSSHSYSSSLIKCCAQNENYCLSRRKLLVSGDIESNPGPLIQDNIVQSVPRIPPVVLLQSRLAQQGLQSLDVGGAGDCFFRAVSHQLYGNTHNHIQIRTIGVQYLENHPERFERTNTERSWVTYLANMSRQGTSCDGIIIQAVADVLNITIHITESNEGFCTI